MADQFPMKLTHPVTKGVTFAGSPGSLGVLERAGWQREKPETASKSRKAEPPTTGDSDS